MFRAFSLPSFFSSGDSDWLTQFDSPSDSTSFDDDPPKDDDVPPKDDDVLHWHILPFIPANKTTQAS